MLLSGVLFVLFLASCWIYCLADASLLPARAFPGLPKRAWVAIIAATFILGAAAWAIARLTWRIRYGSHMAPGHPMIASLTSYPGQASASTADAALARHPAGRSRPPRPGGGTVPRGPDDDAEFLRQLDRRIRGD